MDGLSRRRQERHKIGDTLLLRDRGEDGRGMEGQSSLTADGVATVESMVANANDESKVCQNIDESVLVDGSGGREVVDLGTSSSLNEPLLDLPVTEQIGLGLVVGVDEGLEEGLVGSVDLSGILVEGEGLEGRLSLAVDKTTSLEVVVQVSGLIASVGGPGLADVVSASDVVDIHQLIPMAVGVEA